MSILDFIPTNWNIFRQAQAQPEPEPVEETPEVYFGRSVIDVVTNRVGVIDSFGYSPYGEHYTDENGLPLLDENGEIVWVVCAYVVGQSWADWLPCDDLQLLEETTEAA